MSNATTHEKTSFEGFGNVLISFVATNDTIPILRAKELILLGEKICNVEGQTRFTSGCNIFLLANMVALRSEEGFAFRLTIRAGRFLTTTFSELLKKVIKQEIF